MRFHTLARPVLLGTLIATALLAVPLTTAAQSGLENKTVAESLFREGRRLMDENKFAEACRKLEDSMKLDPAQGTLLNLAVCHEKEGKIATAWAEFNEALVQAKKDARADRETLARERIGAIEPMLPRLAVNVAADVRVPGLEVTRNGVPMGPGTWGTAIPVDPGTVVIEAKAPKRKPWKTTIEIAKQESKQVAIPALEVAPEEPPVALPPGTTTGPVGSAPPSREKNFWTTSRTAGAVIGGVGLVAAGVGTYFGLAALSKRKDSDKYCEGAGCWDKRGVELNDDARKFATYSNITIGVGAAALITGTVLILAGGESDQGPSSAKAAPPSRKIGLTFSLDPRTTGAGVYGSW